MIFHLMLASSHVLPVVLQQYDSGVALANELQLCHKSVCLLRTGGNVNIIHYKMCIKALNRPLIDCSVTEG